MEIKKIGFIGTGVMGGAMAGHLLKAGYELNVFNRTKSRADDLVAAGAKWCDTPRECAEDCDVVISIVGYPEDVRSVWAGGYKGALKGMKKGAIAMDMTTSLPDLASDLYKEAKELGIRMCDCPVTGGDIGARNATLTMLFGGDKDVFEDLQPIFKVLGNHAEYFGEAGKGQLAKACNQIAVAATMFSACEAIVFARNMGLDAEQIINTLSGGAAGSFSLKSYGPRIINRDFAPGFKIDHFIKDIDIALKVCNTRGISLPGLNLARKAYGMLKEMGHGDKGTQALYLFYSSILLPDFAPNAPESAPVTTADKGNK